MDNMTDGLPSNIRHTYVPNWSSRRYR